MQVKPHPVTPDLHAEALTYMQVDSVYQGHAQAVGLARAAASAGLAAATSTSWADLVSTASTGILSPSASRPFSMRGRFSVKQVMSGSQWSATGLGTVMPPATTRFCGSMSASRRACSGSRFAPDLASTTSRLPAAGLNNTMSHTTVPVPLRTGTSRPTVCQPALAKGAGLRPSKSARSSTALIGGTFAFLACFSGARLALRQSD